MRKKVRIVLISSIFLTGCVSYNNKLDFDNSIIRKCPGTPNCVSSMEENEKYYIEPIFVIGTPQEIKDKLLKIISKIENTQVVVSDDNYIQVEFSSELFKFIDDVQFYFPLKEKGKTLIYVRSTSRRGYYDFGVNRKRIELIRSEITQ